jgi:N-acyl-phosphatidylethanolamine-hydrolysing phospholipase D
MLRYVGTASALVLLTSLLDPAAQGASAGAPRLGDRFVNPGGQFERPGISVTLPFFLRRIWASVSPRAGAAPVVAHDDAAIARNPSLTWIGHATFLVRMDGTTFVTDPMFSVRASPIRFAGPRRLVPPGIPLAALPHIDFALLSHDHYDHADVASIQALAARGTRFVVPLGLAAWIRGLGGDAIELDWWEHVELAGVRVHCVPAQHFSGRSLIGQDRRLWAGWVVVGATRRFYHAGDTGYSADFSVIGQRLGPIDIAAVPIGAYEPAAMMRFVHVTPEEAVRIGLDVGARRIVGMHFGTFDLADEPPNEPPRRFRTEADRVGLGTDRAWVLSIGETRDW